MGFSVFELEAPRDLATAVLNAADRIGEVVSVAPGEALVLRVGDATLTVERRDATAADHAEAELRASLCRGAGLDLLARRCARLSRVVRTGGSERDELVAQAALALALLGPVMPDGDRVIYGVRGARERLTASAPGASSR